MRQGPLESTAALFGDVRAGRAAARSVVPGLKRRNGVAEIASASSRCPGLTASFPAAQESRSGGETRRFAISRPRSGLLGVSVQNAPFHASGHDHDLAGDVT